VPETTDQSTFEELSKISTIIRGGVTVTSLINSGFQQSDGWQIIIMAGVPVHERIFKRKLDTFIKDEYDVIFPVVPDIDRQGRMMRLNNHFSNCTLNGIAIHSDTFRKVGNFIDDQNIQYVRLCWAAAALEAGCKFKGVVGLRVN